MNKPFRILTIDAGGSRGLLPATLLADIEERAGQPIYKMFDLIAGTGTGALLAIGLSCPARGGKPLSAAKMLEIFEHPQRSLYHKGLLKRMATSLRGSHLQYSEGRLNRWANHHYHNSTLSDAMTHLMIPTYDLIVRQPHFFKSWKAQGYYPTGREVPEDRDYRIRDMFGASLAEPGLFDPKVISTRSGRRITVIDGNLFAANPSMCALVSAQRLHDHSSAYSMLSLGTGRDEQPLSFMKARFWQPAQWHKQMLNFAIDGSQGAVSYQVDKIFPQGSYVRVNPHLELKKPIKGPDDTRPSVLRALRHAAEQEIQQNTAYAAYIEELKNQVYD